VSAASSKLYNYFHNFKATHTTRAIQNSLLSSFRHFLTLAGRRLPNQYPKILVDTANYLMIGRWMYDHGFYFGRRVAKREEVRATIAKQVLNQRVLYLEFGVYQGDTMRYWSRVLTHPEAKLHGFDSFEGLPEKGGPWHARQFDARGIIPVIDDPRVQFFKGWFQDILPTYVVPAHDVLVLNMDADLYSSTIFVLRHMRPFIKPGTFVYFDEFNYINHETRAFGEFLTESELKFRAFCADKTLAFTCFQCIE
jgi:hypothetical protein